MGAQLFERSRRAVALTPAGLLLQDKARQIVELHQQAGEPGAHGSPWPGGAVAHRLHGIGAAV